MPKASTALAVMVEVPPAQGSRFGEADTATIGAAGVTRMAAAVQVPTGKP